MYILTKSNSDVGASLREMISQFLKDNGITASAIASEIDIHRETLDKFIKGEGDLKFMHAVRMMKILGLTDGQLVSAYCRDLDSKQETSLDKLEQLSYAVRRFDIPVLKKIGIIPSRAKIEEYSSRICSFFGFSSIYEYDDTSLMPVLFSKSRRRVLEEKEAKMTEFWLKCAIGSFVKIDNPNDYDRDLLLQLVRRAYEFTRDESDGYYRFVLVLYQIGVTVLTQSYASGTKAYGGTIIIKGKPCIVITDMGKQYHKLWLSLLHELYHVINDFELLETMNYHFTNRESPEMLLNEHKADEFAMNVLVSPEVRNNLNRLISFPARVNALSSRLGVSPSIIYGVYLESLQNGMQKSKMFSKFSSYLLSSDVATANLMFDPVRKKSLESAIDEIKHSLSRKIV